MTDILTATSSNLVDVLNNVHGFLSLGEAELLYRLASEVPAAGNIVEIGSYQGRSTICLALGAKINGATVWSIDPHEDMQAGDTHFSMADNQHYYENIAKYRVGDVIKTINLPSIVAVQIWRDSIDLLWIDASHEYDDVNADFDEWSLWACDMGKIALHDSSGHFPDVTRALDEILAAGQWVIGEQVDATTVLRRA